MKTFLLFITILIFEIPSFSQNWSENVAQIFYNKCAKCHHSGGISSTPLTTFSEVSPIVAAIQNYVASDEMPPWPPSNTYQQYSHDRALSSIEKTTILNWISAGAIEGNASLTPPLPVFPSGALLGQGDLKVKIPKYMSKASKGHDDYVCFSIPSGLKENRTIKSVEIIPGNRQIVHHALIYIDPTGNENTDISGHCSSPGLTTTKLIAGYTPGCSPMTLPSVSPLKLGIQIPSGSDIYFGMHYPAGSYGEFDSTEVIFHFYPVGETGIRQVYAADVIQNWTFTLPPNQITPVTASYVPLTIDISILSVFPHMHLLGKSIKAYGVTPAKDTLKFANLSNWDFHWQDFYFFKKMQFAPIGTVIKGEGVYDNTSSNPNNPNNPPLTVYPGLNTSDEMFLVYFHYMYHQPGDENYDMNALINASLVEQLSTQNEKITVFPNPSNTDSRIYFKSIPGDNLSVDIYDGQGLLVKKLRSNTLPNTNDTELNWDGTNENGIPVTKGIYFVSINLNGVFKTEKIVRY